MALTGYDDGTDPSGADTAPAGGLGLFDPPEDADQIATLQVEPAAGLSLAQDSAQSLLGHFGLTAETVLQRLAPHLSALTLRLSREETNAAGDAVHEYYELYFGTHPLAGAHLHLHHYRNQLVMLRSRLPAYRLPSDPFADDDFLPLDSLGFATTEDEKPWHAERVIAESSGFPAPAWRISRTDESGATTQLIIDAQTGAIVKQDQIAFDLQDSAPAVQVAHAQVYKHGPKDAGGLITVELPDLPATGYLDGKHFSVYAPGPGDPRVQAADLNFDFRPDDPANALNFDQVQTYYGATVAYQFFHDQLGYDIGPLNLPVQINDLPDGRGDNAMYLPPPDGPMIRIGRGSETLTNLGRETDVVAHEFSHHIIFDHVKVSANESGVLHEGTADYFAYAISGDPYLGESVVPGGNYLRTADLPGDVRFDKTPVRRGAHYRGQLWSAVLWELRSAIGAAAMDKMVFAALAYLGPTAGMRDAFLALLNADRDLNPLETGAAGAGSFGQNRCRILEIGSRRGFGLYLDGIDGNPCGLDITSLVQESRAFSEGKDPPPKSKGKGATFALFGKTCSAVPGARLQGGTQATELGALLMLLLVPLFVSVPLAARPSSPSSPSPAGRRNARGPAGSTSPCCGARGRAKGTGPSGK